ncbi:hypothetical protein T492DRAFT_424225 [Pavlovales sp. CCMP2436]|nr:hypothetical protein T492DRAFT_424225 [Pavlovales sp. CCMP2436]
MPILILTQMLLKKKKKTIKQGPYTIVHHTETVRQLPSLSPLSPLSNPIPSPRHAPSALFNTPILSASPGLALTPIPSTSPTPNHPNFPIPGLLKNLDPASAVPSPLPSPSSLSFNPNHRPSLNPAARPPRAPTGGVSESGGLLVSESGGVLGSGGLLVASDNGGSGEWKRREEVHMLFSLLFFSSVSPLLCHFLSLSFCPLLLKFILTSSDSDLQPEGARARPY